MDGKELNLDETLASYRPRIAGFISSMTHGDVDIDDMVQETLIRISKGLENYREESSLSSWVFQVASNVVKDDFRSKASRRGQFNHWEVANFAEPEDNLTQIVKRETRDCVRDGIASLPEKYRQTLVLFYMEGMSVKEIAASEGSSENSVKVRLHRARKRFRKICASTCNVTTDPAGTVACEPKGDDLQKNSSYGQPGL